MRQSGYTGSHGVCITSIAVIPLLHLFDALLAEQEGVESLDEGVHVGLQQLLGVVRVGA